MGQAIYRDLIRLSHLGDLGMSEMIGLMRLHVQEVTRFTAIIGHRLVLNESQVRQFKNDMATYNLGHDFFVAKTQAGWQFTPTGLFFLTVCAKVHDIGKPFFRTIYALERSLEKEEFLKQRLHANFTRIIVKSWRFYRNCPVDNHDLINSVADMAAEHQEKYDGTGYPDGKAGEQISFVGRFLAITDAISAMINPRPYQKAMPVEYCIDQLNKSAGSHFDPELSTVVVRVLEERHWNDRLLGNWEEPEKFSDDYLSFVTMIDLENIDLGRGDVEQMAALSGIINEKLENHR